MLYLVDCILSEIQCDCVLCLIGLIAFHLKCDMIMYYVWLIRCDCVLFLIKLIASYLKCDVIN